MTKRRVRSAQNKAGRRKPGLIDFISQMSDDVLLVILSFLTLKDAVGTSSLSTLWRFVWCKLIKLDIDGTETLDNMPANDKRHCVLAPEKYINQVYSVIRSHNNPMVQCFRIRFDLDKTYFKDIDNWLKFALDKKVEHLKLNIMENLHPARDKDENYDIPILLLDGNMVELISERPSLSFIAAKTLSLKKLSLLRVNVSNSVIDELLNSSPHLEMLYIFGAGWLTHISIGGPDIRLKRLELVGCTDVEYICLYDFDLVSFTYDGPEIKLRLQHLPKIKELNVCGVGVGLENNIFRQISSFVSSLEVLLLDIDSPKEGFDINTIPVLPNIKKLRLMIIAEGDDSLLEYTSIAEACPSLETFTVSLIWSSPIKRRRKVRHVSTDHPYQHLKLVEIVGYYGRISDLELVVYVIDNSVALRKIVIDPFCNAFKEDFTRNDLLKKDCCQAPTPINIASRCGVGHTLISHSDDLNQDLGVMIGYILLRLLYPDTFSNAQDVVLLIGSEDYEGTMARGVCLITNEHL